jgi:hypothetical protein
MKLCACGCGTPVNRTWVKTHHFRVDRSKLTEAIRRRNTKYSGERHPRWLGEAVDYKQLHKWINRKLVRVGRCAACGAAPPARADGRSGTDWANISGAYRRDLADWRELCHPCNMRERAGA